MPFFVRDSPSRPQWSYPLPLHECDIFAASNTELVYAELLRRPHGIIPTWLLLRRLLLCSCVLTPDPIIGGQTFRVAVEPHLFFCSSSLLSAPASIKNGWVSSHRLSYQFLMIRIPCVLSPPQVAYSRFQLRVVHANSMAASPAQRISTAAGA